MANAISDWYNQTFAKNSIPGMVSGGVPTANVGAEDQMRILQQMKMAEMLRQQGATPLPQGSGMVRSGGGGQWAAPDQAYSTFGESLGKLGSSLAGGWMEKNANDEAKAYAEKLRAQQDDWNTKLIKGMTGQDAVSATDGVGVDGQPYANMQDAQQQLSQANPLIQQPDMAQPQPQPDIAQQLMGSNIDKANQPTPEALDYAKLLAPSTQQPTQGASAIPAKSPWTTEQTIQHYITSQNPEDRAAGNKMLAEFLKEKQAQLTGTGAKVGYTPQIGPNGEIMAFSGFTGAIKPALMDNGQSVISGKFSPQLTYDLSSARTAGEAANKMTKAFGRDVTEAQAVALAQSNGINTPWAKQTIQQSQDPYDLEMAVGTPPEEEALLRKVAKADWEKSQPKPTVAPKLPSIAEQKNEEKFAETSAQTTAVNQNKEYEAAIAANTNLNKLDSTLADLQNGKGTTGALSGLTNEINRFKTYLTGSKSAGKEVAETEILQAALGSDVFPLIQSLGIGARGMDTPAERDFLMSVMTGSRELNRDTLIKMTQTRKNIAERVMNKFNEKVDSGQMDNFFKYNNIPKSRINRDKSRYFEVKDPNGDAHIFNSQAEADNFKALIKGKP